MKNLRYFDPHRRATWLELFFDLIIVVALRNAGEILSETHDGRIAPQQFLHVVLVFPPLWWIWAGHTIYASLRHRQPPAPAVDPADHVPADRDLGADLGRRQGPLR